MGVYSRADCMLPIGAIDGAWGPTARRVSEVRHKRALPWRRVRVGPPPSRREGAPRHLPHRGRIWGAHSSPIGGGGPRSGGGGSIRTPCARLAPSVTAQSRAAPPPPMGEDLRRLRPLTQDAVEEGGLPGPVRTGEEEQKLQRDVESKKRSPQFY